MFRLLILIAIVFLFNSCCTKTHLTPEEKTWVQAYKVGQKIIFRSNHGYSDTVDVIRNREFYSNCDCNWFEISTTQANSCQVELKPRYCHNKNYCSIIIQVTKEHKNEYSAPFFTVFGLEHPDRLTEKGEDLYLNNLKKSVTLSTTGKHYKSAYFFKSGVNADNYGDDYLKSFYWDKIDGLIRYECYDGEVYELLTKDL